MIKLRHFLLKYAFIPVFLLSVIPEAQSQNGFPEPANQYNPKRLRGVVITEIAGGLLVTTGLYYLWYRKHPRSHFHFFNDNQEWLQVDKWGHATTAYTVSAVQY